MVEVLDRIGNIGNIAAFSEEEQESAGLLDFLRQDEPTSLAVTGNDFALPVAPQPVETEQPSRFRDLVLRAGGGRPSLLNTLSAAFGQGTEEIAARKRADLVSQLEEAETRARITALQAPPKREIIEDVTGRKRFRDTGDFVFKDVGATQETFEPVTDPTTGDILGQRNTLTGEVKTDPRAGAAVKERAQRVATEEREIKVRGNIQNIDDTTSLLDRLTNHPGLSPAVGAQALFPTLPGTDASDFEAIVETTKARLGFDELARMRANSPSGGALGQISERELSFLQAAVQSLSINQSEEQFKENVGLIGESLGRFKDAQQQFLSGEGQEQTDTLPTVTNQAEFDALPSGTIFTEDGQQWRKP